MWIALVQKRYGQYHHERDKFLDLLKPEQLESVRKRILDWKPTVISPKQKDLLDLPWELCTLKPCRASSDGDMVSFHCLITSGDPNYIINKNTNEIESQHSAPY